MICNRILHRCIFSVFFFILILPLGIAGAQATQTKAFAPLTVKDCNGHEITLTRRPQRIACLYAFTGHVTTMLGRGDGMVAVVKGLKRDRLLGQLLPGLKKLPVPAAGGTLHIETLLKTRPDIIFLKPETARVKEEIKKLERFNLPYFTVGYRSMDQQMEMIEKMGAILGCTPRAKAYTHAYRRAMAQVREKTGQLAPKDRARLYHSVNETFRTVAPGTLEADWSRACNVVNVSLDQTLVRQGEKNFAAMEQILLWNPQVILANEKRAAREILTHPKWAPIRAVKAKRVYAMPVGISRWGHPGGLETPLALLWTGKTVYPHLFPDLDMEAEVMAFYNDFFAMEVDRSLARDILGAKGMRR